MERKNIAFQYGIHRSPSAANEGELSECINLEVHNGEITPSVMPEVAFTLSEGDKLLFVHKSGNYKNFIIQRGNLLMWFSDEDKTTIYEIGEITPTSIHSVGNTLVVLSRNNMEYILYKSGYYKRIGNKPPFCCISFGLSEQGLTGMLGTVGEFTIEGAASDTADWFTGFKDGIRKYIDDGTEPRRVSYENDLPDISTGNWSGATKYVNAMTDSIFPQLNKLVSSNRRFGAFMHPFYLRYAYRMYDGSHYMHSAPIFFPVNMMGPVVSAVSYKDSDHDFSCFYKISLDIVKLDYSICGFYDEDGNEVSSDSIKDWEDIITGLDVFASNSIYPYKQNGYVTGYWGSENIYGDSLCSTMSERISLQIYKNRLYSDSFPQNTLSFTLEKNEDFVDQIKEVGQFYKVSEFKGLDKISVLPGFRFPLSIKEDVLTSLEQQEVLDDDYDSHNKIIPSFAHVYNGRLNVSGIKTKIFSGFPLESMVPYTFVPGEPNYSWSASTKLEIDGNEIEVVSKSHILLHNKPAFIYYPSPKVKEFTLYMYNNNETPVSSFSATFKAEVHKLLNGSFYLSSSFGELDSYTLDLHAANPQPKGNPYVFYPNKIYTSEVNNPFFFPLSGRNSIGTGEIVAITSNSKAISPGQFGEYPLIVFSTDGVWAMQTGEEGLYYSVHPISKDICINPNILQTDGPVLFVTDNGLHSIASESVENISRIIKGKPEKVDLPAVDEHFTLLSTITEDSDTFNEFIRTAVFAFDYMNRRVIISHPDKPFAYVYSMDSGMYSKMVILKEGSPVTLGGSINAYPEVYMQSGTDIYTFVTDKDTQEELSHGLLVTRPLVFSDPLTMKAINDLRLIYHKTKEGTRCRYAMLVSNDGRTWKQRGSLRGHSFKYFRFAVFTELSDIDALQGMSLMYDYRRTNKLR